MDRHLICGVSALWFLAAVSAARGQDVGVQTFNDLVGQAIENPPRPPTSPTPTAREIETGKQPVPSPSPFVLQPTIGAEYDYRFNQQKNFDRFATDINEVHTYSSFALPGLTKLWIEYFHLWTDATNDTGLSRSLQADVLKIMINEKIGNVPKDPAKDLTYELVFSLPSFLRTDNQDALTSGGRRLSEGKSLTLNPLLVFSVSRPINSDPNQNLRFSLSPGYRWFVGDKDYTNVDLPDVHTWSGRTSLLLRTDYSICKSIAINGSVTWNHVTNFHASDSTPSPDPNAFALATGLVYKPELLWQNSAKTSRPLSIAATYQYDGFNHDFYQHSLTLLVSYAF